MNNSTYNDKMYKMLMAAKQSSEMGGWSDKLSKTLDSVHKSLEKSKADYIPQIEPEERSL